jgi:hypothetical protein
MVMLTIAMIIIVLVFIITAIPLNIAVHLLGGHSNLFKTAFVNFIVGLIGAAIYAFAPFGGLLAFVALLVVYKFMFGLSFLRALLAWVLQFVIAGLIFWALIAFGVLAL